ncbi:RsmD family RNA methyltransferase [uncultured Amnibacterium sp.]|uniref:RsmD family RNA methyltransferase n=1 Tax=uncultured Amnibacterium sp. TaxID=1631851 RepID=UPI0035CA9BC4
MPRIIAGAAGSLQLRTPRSGTRPTSDRVREGIFSALEARGVLDGARVLDLYAGSGALGLEAVSRGAASAVLVERSGGALAVLRQNVRVVTDALPEADRPLVTVVGRPVHTYLTSLPVLASLPALASMPLGDAAAPTLVFLDPPYDLPDTEVADDLRLLAVRAADDATLVLERSARGPSPHLPPEIESVRSRDYGETRVHLLTVVRSSAEAPE